MNERLFALFFLVYIQKKRNQLFRKNNIRSLENKVQLQKTNENTIGKYCRLVCFLFTCIAFNEKEKEI